MNRQEQQVYENAHKEYSRRGIKVGLMLGAIKGKRIWTKINGWTIFISEVDIRMTAEEYLMLHTPITTDES